MINCHILLDLNVTHLFAFVLAELVISSFIYLSYNSEWKDFIFKGFTDVVAL